MVIVIVAVSVVVVSASWVAVVSRSRWRYPHHCVFGAARDDDSGSVASEVALAQLFKEPQLVAPRARLKCVGAAVTSCRADGRARCSVLLHALIYGVIATHRGMRRTLPLTSLPRRMIVNVSSEMACDFYLHALELALQESVSCRLCVASCSERCRGSWLCRHKLCLVIDCGVPSIAT